MLLDAIAALLLFRFADDRITESSGVAVACPSGLVLTHNDSGDSARFFAVDRTGRTVATYTLPGAQAVDWEDIARAGDELLLADIGDNLAARASVDLYRVRMHDGGPPYALRWTRQRLRYPDGAHDAEALYVVAHRSYVVTKVIAGGAGVYQAPASGDGVFTRVGTVSLGLVTGADAAPDGRVVLRTYGAAYEWPDARLVGPGREIALPAQRQGEGVAYDCDSRHLLVSSEGVHEPVYRVPLSRASASPTATATSVPPSPPAVVASRPLHLVACYGWVPPAVAAAAVGGWLMRRRR